MANETKDSTSNVILIEPNEVNTEGNPNINAIPQYQDMYIFAELTATSKGRTIIKNSNVKTTKSKIINFIGNNQNNDNPDNPDPNYLNFTTNYYDGSTGSETHYEGFGINSIKIVINSSFIPQVNIQFVDVRGLAFFNQKDSPYRILFDFPPPIFELTVKGYYGRPLKYSLHLVKYTSEFNASNGNFVIDAQFVAVTFAPLSDILFRYVVNTPLIDKKDSLNPSTFQPPTNTFELILKLKSLYAAFADLKNTDVEIQEYQEAITDLKKISDIENTLNDYKNNKILNADGVGTPYMVARTAASRNVISYPIPVTEDTVDIQPLNRVTDFDALLYEEKTTGDKNRKDNKLFIVYPIGPVDPKFSTNELFTTPNFFEFDTENYEGFHTALKSYKETLLNQKLTSTYYGPNDIIDPKNLTLDYDVQTNKKTNTKYYGMDITGYYVKIFKKKVALQKKRGELEDEVVATINTLVARELGMLPSIYNIFSVILGDVDAFFTKLKKVSVDAYDEHNANLNLILNSGAFGDTNNGEESTEIFAFPLIINSSLKDREERVAPIELSKKTRFPELELVDDFITTFLDQKIAREQYELRDGQDNAGDNRWVPFSPFDSTLGGARPQSPYMGTANNVRDETLKILLKRFYMLTQGTIPDTFYTVPTGKRRIDKNNVIVGSAYSTLYSEAEAINLISSITSELSRGQLETMSKQYTNTKLGRFYEDIAKLEDTYDNGSGEPVSGKLYSFPTNDPKQFPVNPSDNSQGRVYTDKNNANFEGMVVVNDNLDVQDTSEKSKNPIDNFASNADNDSFLKRDPIEKFFEFTSENLLYIKDWSKRTEDHMVDNLCTFTRYLCDFEDNYLVTEKYFPGWDVRGIEDDDVARQTIAYEKGNASFKYHKEGNKKFLNKGQDALYVWYTMFGRFDDEIVPIITGDANLGSIILLSNFGNVLSPFNVYPNALNIMVFDTPSAIEVPACYAPYLGGLLTAIEADEPWVDDIVDFFTTGTGRRFQNRGFFVLADLHDVEKYLSVEDKKKFKDEYKAYMRKYGTISTNLNTLYGVVAGNTEVYKTTQYRYYFDPNSEKVDDLERNQGMGFTDIEPHLIRRNIINYSQITFSTGDTYNAGYTSLATQNLDPDKKTKNDNFFLSMFQKFNSLIEARGDFIRNREEEFGKLKGGSDIKNQLYYSFKNINDKWLSGTAKGVPNYPFNGPSNKLIDMFAFVDRGMNPIGETILNAEILIDMMEDPNISLFSVLSQLLSLNGFEFFPLQNFMKIDNEEAWKDSFKIHTSGYDDVENTFFVCMYIGGSSSYPSVSGNGFTNDGILDIAAPGIKGFNGKKPTKDEIDDLKKLDFDSLNENEKQILQDEFPFQEVRAFRVRFGEQNQSMFTDIKIDSKEYPETNESIQILSRIAGDGNPNAPVPQGQSLYNLYENRSYRAVVTGFGNAMIQPTQYFQLENIPLFNGAYIILDVEHDITANKMTTTFGGTKLLEYPVPRVTNPVAFMDLEGFTAEALQNHLNSQNKINEILANLAIGMSEDRIKNQLDAMYGVDVSHHNGNIDWKKAVVDGIEFAVMKLSEGIKDYDSNAANYDLVRNIEDCIAAGVELTYYHFAYFGRTSDPSADGIADADNFISKLVNYDKPKLPVVFDIENDSFHKEYLWSNKTTDAGRRDIQDYIEAFIHRMEASGYNDIIIYSGNDFLKPYGVDYLKNYPLWLARWYDLRGKHNPERDRPTAPQPWFDWTIWQFSANGMIDGVGGRVDLDVMKRSFFDKYV